MQIKILIVEDDERLRDVLLEAAAMEGYDAHAVSSAEAAVERLRQEPFAVLVTDVTLPGMSGLDLLRHCPRLRPGILPVVITAHGTVDLAVEAMKRGATDFITKPFELDGLLGAIRVAAERAARAVALAEGSGSPAPAAGPANLVATSPVMRGLLEQVRAIAPFPTTVLVTGETGAGKEMVARAVHQLSPRREKALVALNCAAVPEQLLEDELFGHVKGAFTGAQGSRAGRFEQADGGTLFLDEIANITLAQQARLLRVIESGEFERVGSSQTRRADVRLVSATNAALEQDVQAGRFRQDLLFRLNTVQITIPPLRDRREDIPPLAAHFLNRFARRYRKDISGFDAAAVKAMLAHPWNGNVRELEHAVERAVLMSGAAQITRADLALETPAQATIEDMSIEEVEALLIRKALARFDGNVSRAAELLGLSRSALYRRIQRYSL